MCHNHPISISVDESAKRRARWLVEMPRKAVAMFLFLQGIRTICATTWPASM